MNCFSLFFCLVVTLLSAGITAAEPPPQKHVVWNIDNLQRIGGQKVEVVGNPRVLSVGQSKAIQFDGEDDALFFDVHPLAGARQFTAEVIFRPDSGGPAAQRFFHLQETGSEDRILFETRLTKNGKWFLDTFIKSGKGNHTLFAEKHLHPVDHWYHAALVVDGKTMRHYVNGQLEMKTDINYTPQKAGKTSLGVRINKVHWFKGAVRTIRFTREVLQPKDFLEL